MKSVERQLLYVFIFLGILLVGLIVGISYYHSSYDTSFFTYHNFDFKNVGNGFQIQLYINGQQIPRLINLRSDPRELEDISLDSEVTSLLDADEIFITINPYDNLTGITTLAVLEVDKILDNPFLYNIPVNATFTEPYTSSSLLVKTCSDSTEKVPVLWFRLEDSTRVYQQDGCFIVAGTTEEDLIRAADRLLYTLLGIMKL